VGLRTKKKNLFAPKVCYGLAVNRQTAKRSLPQASRRAFADLLTVCRRLKFEPHDIARQLDARGHYDLLLQEDFPFSLRLFQFTRKHCTPIWNWHERLELIMPMDGAFHLRMGELPVELAAGDLLVVDNLKLHRVEDLPGLKTRAIVVSFMPEFVYSPGSPACDYTFLLPFYTKPEGQAHVLRATDALAAPIYRAMAELIQRYFESREIHFRSGCKATFLEILYHLTRRFQASEVLRSEFVERRQQADRLARLFEYVRANYAERITVEQATRLVHMSQSQFMKVFKRVAGMTFVAHVTRVRVNEALRLLRESDLTIAEIAVRIGFPDQSYFDRRFKQAFGKSPSQYRADLTEQLSLGAQARRAE
jgi:AraC family transcriptional activator of pobA